MATRYIDTDTGNDANSGADWANAWLSWDKLLSTVVDGDVVYHRGVATMSSTYLNSQVSNSAGFSLIRDPASFSTKTKVLLGLNVDTRYIFSDSIFFQGLEFTLDYNNPIANYNNGFLSFSVSNRANKIQDCKFIPINTNDLYYSRPLTGSATGPIFISCEFDGSLSKNCVLFAIGDVSLINCDIHDFKEEPGVWLSSFSFIQTNETSGKIFENNRFWNISVPRIFRESLSPGENSNYLIRYNTFYFNSSYQNQHVNLMSSNGAEYTWNSFNLHDNVIVSENATYNFKINDTATAMEAPLSGYNAISSNIVLTNYSPTFADTIITAADFASTNPLDANFLQPAAASTLEGLTGLLPNRTPGFYQVPGGGAAPDYPLESDVRSGVSFDSGAKTGTAAIPSPNDVRSGVNVDATTGNLVLPGVAKVINDTSFGTNGTELTGTYDAPTASEVKIGSAFGALSAETGTYDGSDRWSDPGENNVENGVAYKANSLTNNKTGNFQAPSVNDVQDGVGFGSNGLEFTGNFEAPATTDVREGTGYGSNGTEFTGTLDPDAEANIPATTDVRSGTTYGEGNLQTGTAVIPSPNDVRDGTNVDATIGNLELPAEANVLDGVGYGSNSTEFTGTDKGESFNTSLSPAQIKLGESIQNLGETVIGTYDAVERYTDVPVEEVNLNFEYRYNSLINNRTGTSVGTCDYPAAEDVEDGVEYANGSLVGTLGEIDTNNLDIASQLEVKLNDLIASTLPDYGQMRYIIDPAMNDFNNNTKQFGILINEDQQDLEQTNFCEDVVDLNLEIVLLSDWIDDYDDDLQARNAVKELKKSMEAIRRKIRATRAGTYNTGKLNSVIPFNTLEPEYDMDRKLVILRAFLTLKYRVR